MACCERCGELVCVCWPPNTLVAICGMCRCNVYDGIDEEGFCVKCCEELKDINDIMSEELLLDCSGVYMNQGN